MNFLYYFQCVMNFLIFATAFQLAKLATETSRFRFFDCKSAKRFRIEKIHASLAGPKSRTAATISVADSALYIKPSGHRRFGIPGFSNSKTALCHFAKICCAILPEQDHSPNNALINIIFIFQAHLATDLQRPPQVQFRGGKAMMINQTFEAISTVPGPFGQPMKISENDVFVFDIDAVSNAHQREMDPAFASYLSDFARHRACYLLTSCNYAETATRIPSRVRRELAGIFSSAGTELWHRNELLVRHEHSFSDDIYECIVKLLLRSSYPAKQTPLIDCGAATLRICLAGTRAGLAAKRAYLEWEREHGELDKIVEALESRFPDHSVYRDTEVSLLFTPRSYSTALVQKQILKRHKSARLVAYLKKTAADGFAAPLCDALQEGDIVSKVGGASDVSQLLSYENRRIQEKNERIWNPLRLVQEA